MKQPLQNAFLFKRFPPVVKRNILQNMNNVLDACKRKDVHVVHLEQISKSGMNGKLRKNFKRLPKQRSIKSTFFQQSTTLQRKSQLNGQ